MKKILFFFCTLFAGYNSNAQQLLMDGGFRVVGTTSGQVATYNGTKWVPGNAAVTANAPLTGNGTPATPLKLADGTAVGQALVWNGTAWAAQEQSSFTLADQTSIEGTGQVSDELKLAGISTAPIRSFPFSDGTGGIQWTTMQVAPSIAGNGINTPLSIAQQGATNGQVLAWNGTTWLPTTPSAADGSETKVNAGTGISVTGTGTTGSPYVVTNSDPDQNVSNEGLIGVQAGSATTAIISTNTSTGTGVTITAAGSLSVSESTSANGGTITLTGATKREELFTASASQTNFTLTASLAAPSGTNMPLEVRRNGVRLYYTSGAPSSTQFSYTSNTVTLSACDAGDIITVNYIQ